MTEDNRVLGFTGTRYGMTNVQLEVFKAICAEYNPKKFLHGACVGADAQATEHVYYEHGAYQELYNWCYVYAYPGLREDMRSEESLRHSLHVASPIDALTRDRFIVDNCDLLVGCSYTYMEVRRSGTWYTLRYAKKTNKPYIIIWPDGTTAEEF